ncbi:hypothetical protein IP84_17420 [beta proteobacterium AAP99]|nr:hypothetical protein IP84_17420 [beta proteobacterium AAP99]
MVKVSVDGTLMDVDAGEKAFVSTARRTLSVSAAVTLDALPGVVTPGGRSTRTVFVTEVCANPVQPEKMSAATTRPRTRGERRERTCCIGAI